METFLVLVTLITIRLLLPLGVLMLLGSLINKRQAKFYR